GEETGVRRHRCPLRVSRLGSNPCLLSRDRESLSWVLRPVDGSNPALERVAERGGVIYPPRDLYRFLAQSRSRLPIVLIAQRAGQSGHHPHSKSAVLWTECSERRLEKGDEV